MENNRKRVIALGFFDGVHLGHQALLRRTAERAGMLGLSPALLTFDRSPFGPVDGLILSALSYVHFDALVSESLQEAPVPLGKAAEGYLSLPAARRGRCRCEDDLKLLRALANSPASPGWGCAAVQTGSSQRRRPSSPPWLSSWETALLSWRSGAPTAL